ncbi:hypothetical protein IWW36_004376 [Coemansia brasiliensis]|uniref:Amino acid transporter transmembrane domain-containing protein n=1 Tax=Coemansia brasiliensis TaxID=2650707 RepID=A0A9W8LWB5_9FUNG|nr:hypothetical protein IWW36_004376 [Coemansia brasiliensis]
MPLDLLSKTPSESEGSEWTASPRLPEKGESIQEQQPEVQSKRTGSSFGAYLNLICVVVGTGSLSLPKTFQQSGWIGILLVIACGIIGAFTGMLIVRCLNLMSQERERSFNQIGQAAFGIPGRLVVYVLHMVYVVGIVGDYIILSGQSFDRVARDHGHDIGEIPWKIICAAAMWLACISLKQMSEAAVLSVFGFSTSLAAVTIGVVQAIIAPYDSNTTGTNAHHQATHEAANGSGVAIALATISFSFCAVVVMPAVEASMRRPKRWGAVVGSAMGTVTSIYLIVGTVGYWAFGDQTKSPFFDNLPQNAATSAARILISLHVIFAAPIIAASFALEIELALGITRERLGWWKELALRVLIRTVFFGAMTGIALAIPYFGDVMSLVGAFSTSLLLCVIPAGCYVKLRGWRQISWAMRIACTAVAAVGIYACVLGAKSAIEDLQTDIANDN